MNKKLLFAIVIPLGLSLGVSRAAIDDEGMNYVSAAEGLSGSIRVRLLADSDFNEGGFEDQQEINLGDSRIVYRGENEIGSGTAVTYYLELRPKAEAIAETRSGRHGLIELKYLDAGLKGFFGDFRFGYIETASSAIVPSADRSNDAGSTGYKLADEYLRGAVRWVSPSLKGVVFGASAEMEDVQGRSEDKAFDNYDVAVTYSFMGFDMGGSYAVKDLRGNDRSATNIADAENVFGKGYRLGARYEGSSWGVGYNYHRYKAFVHQDILSEVVDNSGGVRGREIFGNQETEQEEHVLGANFSYSRLNFSLTHSRANVSNDTIDNLEGEGTIDVDFKNSAFDVSYRLGGKSQVIAAYTISKDTRSDGTADKVKGYYLMLRTDF